MDFKTILIHHFQEFIKELEMSKEPQYKFKISRFRIFLKQLASLDAVRSIKDIETLPGVGKGILRRVEEIMAANPTNHVVSPLRDIDRFQTIPWVGEASAIKLVDLGVTWEDLMIKQTPSALQHLNRNQQIGVRHYGDLQQRIPRREIQHLENWLAGQHVEFIICGSYRRGKATSGDVDILVEGEEHFIKLVKILQPMTLENLTPGSKTKFMSVVRLDRIARRLDVMRVESEEFPTSLLYFTGSQEENIRLRKKAISMGYKLNEHGLWKNSKRIPTQDEKQVYKILQEPYKEPRER